jgi:predicted permease
VLGSLAGFGLAYASIPVVLRLVPYLRNPATQVLITPAIDLAPDWRVLLFISVGCLVSGMLFGVAPAITALRFDLNRELKQFYGSTLRATRVGPILVCLQMVLSVVLMSTSISMVHSYWNLLHTNTGFDDDHIITFRISPAAGGYQDQQLRGYYERLLQQVRGLSQIRAASLVSYGVMRGKGFGAIITPTHSAMSGGASFQVSWNLVSPGYFETMGMHILEGRDLRPDEGKDERPPFPVVVDEQFAHMVFPNQDVIGRTFAQGISGSAPPVYHVVGLVTNAKYRSLRDTLSPTFYVQPIWTDRAVGVLNLYVRTSGDPHSLVTHIRQAIRATDSNVPIIEITTLKMEEQNSVWQERVLLIITIFFGIAGLVLANIGLYGLLAQYVVQQKRNIGIRMALGAQTSHIVGAVCFSSMMTVLIGLCCGVLLGRVALHFIDAFLYGVTSSDPISYVVSVALILSTTLLAALIPTLQAIRLHPASVLRTN